MAKIKDTNRISKAKIRAEKNRFQASRVAFMAAEEATHDKNIEVAESLIDLRYSPVNEPSTASLTETNATHTFLELAINEAKATLSKEQKPLSTSTNSPRK